MTDWSDVASFDKAASAPDQWDAVASFPKQFQAEPPAKPKSTMGPFEAGFQGSRADLGTTIARVAHAVGAPETADDWLKASEARRQRVSEQYHPKVPSYEDIYKPDDLLGSAGRAGQYAYEKFAESAPQMAALGAAGVAGALAAPAAIPGAVAGLGAAALADVPFFTGSNLKAQMETGKKLGDTSLGKAALAAVPQSLLDVALGEVLPGVGRAVGGRMLTRAAKKAIEGGLIESTSEGLQQAIEIGQADPDKLFRMDPATQKEILEAAVAGGVLGGGFGGVAGAAQRRKQAAVPPPEETPPPPGQLALPAPPIYGESPWAPQKPPLMIEDMRGDRQPPKSVPDMVREQEDWQRAQALGSSAMPPYTPPTPRTQPLPGMTEDQIAQQALSPTPPHPGGRLGDGPIGPDPMTPLDIVEQAKTVATQETLAPTIKSKSGGRQVYEDIRNQLLAAGQSQMEANANATIVRKAMERMGARLGRDAWSVYREWNVQVQGEGSAPKGGESYAQSHPTYEAGPYSKARRELERTAMKKGTGQQWLNYLQQRGVKADELEWTDLKDQLGLNKDMQFTKEELLRNMFLYDVGKITNEPLKAGKQGYSAVTLDNHGENPEANYRENMLFEHSDVPRTKDERFESSHWPFPNVLAHYRTTDRATNTGESALHVEELQSDLHQQGRKRGYRGSDEDMEKARSDYRLILSKANRDATLGQLTAETRQQVEAARLAYSASQQGVPNFPFKETWPNLVFKHALMDAINKGKDYLTWTNGTDMAHVQGHDDERRISAHKKFMDERIVNIANKIGKPYGAKVEQIKMPGIHNPDNFNLETLTDEQISHLRENNSLRDEGHTVHAMKITPAMRELIGHGGMELFQKNKSNRGDRGGITFLPDQTIIRLLKSSDASTFMHESAHLFLNMMRRYAPQNRSIAADLQEVLQWVGVKDAASITVAQHEKFARGFELYLREGKAPSKGLAAVFAKFKEWLSGIYHQASQLKIKVPPNISRVFDRLLVGEPMSARRSPTETLSSSTPNGVEDLHAAPDANPPSVDPETFSQSSRADPNDLRETMRRSNDNADPRGWGNHHLEMAKIYNQKAKSFDEKAATWKGYAQKAIASNGRHTAKAFLEGMEQYKTEAKTARSERDAYLARHAQENPHTFESYDQSPVENERSIYNGSKNAWQWLKQSATDVSDSLSRVADKELYLDQRGLMKGHVYEGEQASKEALALYTKANPAEQQAITAYFKSAAASPLQIPERVRADTVRLKTRIRNLGEKLVQAGALSPTTFAANENAYLPQLYLKHLLDHGGITGAGMKANLNWQKKKKNLPLETRLALGEINHPGVLTSVALIRMERDLAALNFLDQVSRNENWSLGRSLMDWKGKRVTPEWLLSEAEDIQRRKTGRAAVMERLDPAAAARMRVLADQMKAAAEDAKEELGDVDIRQWKQLPNKPQFGALRGAWVQSQIVDDITGMADFVNEHSWAGRVLGDKNSAVVKATQYWKMLKVPFSPAAQMRNFVSNAIAMNVFGKVPLHKVPLYIHRALQEMRHDGPVWTAAKQYGIPQGSMAENEIHALADSIARGIENDGFSGPMGLMRLWRTAQRAGQAVTDVYGKSESLFKTAVMVHAMEKGASAAEAARRANEAIFDYSQVHASIKYLRNAPLGAPFLTYVSKMLPQLAKTIASKDGALRLLPYVGLMAALPAMVASMWDLEDGDIDRLKKAMSEALRRSNNNMYLMPYKDQANNWQFVDIGYFFPWQFAQDIGTGLAKGKPDEAAKPIGQMAFSNPIISAITALKTNMDSFTGRPIADPRDPATKQATDILGYVWSLAMPSVLANYGALGKTFEKLDGTGVNRYGEPTPDWLQIGARMFGVNIYPIIPEMQRARNLQHMQTEIQQTKSRMTFAMRDKSLTGEQRQRLQSDYTDKIKDMTAKMVEYSRESAMTPSLRAASSRP